MKTIFRFFLFISAITFLTGCTLTKRKYTGGYYVNWHNKSPETKSIVKAIHIPSVSNKIAKTNILSEKAIVNSKTDKTINQQVIPLVTKVYKGREIAKSISNPVTSTINVTPQNKIPDQDEPENDVSKNDVRLSWLLCLLGFLSGLLLGFIAIGQAFGNNNSTLAGLILLLPLALVTLSFVHCVKAMKGGHNGGVMLIILIDILIAVILFISIWGLFFSPLI